MCNDQSVRVVRVKNRTDPAYDSRASVGYRDVAVNLRIVTPETAKLGVDGHVCELQLIPRAIAELKVQWPALARVALVLRVPDPPSPLPCLPERRGPPALHRVPQLEGRMTWTLEMTASDLIRLAPPASLIHCMVVRAQR